MKRLLLAVIAVLSISAQSAYAERDFAAIYKECGLGAMLFPNDPVIAVVTNITWDLGTTAVSSNALSEETCKGGAATTASLIYETYPMIEKDLAAGEGEHLTAMLESAGCSATVHSAITGELRGELASTTAGAGYEDQTRFEKSESLYNAISDVISSDHANECAIG